MNASDRLDRIARELMAIEKLARESVTVDVFFDYQTDDWAEGHAKIMYNNNTYTVSFTADQTRRGYEAVDSDGKEASLFVDELIYSRLEEME